MRKIITALALAGLFAVVGIAVHISRNLRLYADLNGEFNGRERAGMLSVGLRFQWQTRLAFAHGNKIIQ